jgi:hypothetical protein
MVDILRRKAFSSEVGTGSREENAKKQKPMTGSDAIRSGQALSEGNGEAKRIRRLLLRGSTAYI